jgi:hypothetical protein
MTNDLKSLIEIEETKLNILLEDLSSKTQEYLSKRFEIDQKSIELSQIRKDVYSLQLNQYRYLCDCTTSSNYSILCTVEKKRSKNR